MLQDFLTDGLYATEEEGLKLCVVMQKQFTERGLVRMDDQRDTIMAQKLLNPVTINDLVDLGHSGILNEVDYMDPLLQDQARNLQGNYNTDEDKQAWIEKKNQKQK